MSRNPFDDLEKQLHAAVSARRRRERRRGSRRTLLAVGVALALTGGVAAASTLLSNDADQAAAQRAVDRGTSAAHRLSVCATRRSPAKVVEIPGPPSAPVLAQLGVFRRAARAGDRAPRGVARTPSAGAVLLKDTVRVVHADNGQRFLLFMMRGARFPGPADPVACEEAARGEALKAARGSKAAVRERVQTIMSKRVARAKSIVTGATEQLNFVQFSPNGRSIGGTATYIADGKIPALANVTAGFPLGQRTMTISGLVPDGVTTVTAIDRSGPQGARVAPVTARVHDNVYSLVAPRRMGPRITLDWRDSAGKTLRRVHVHK